MILDTHSDHLEIIGDMLPTEAERAELNAYFDALDERELIAQMHADSKRGLAGANVVDTLPEFGFGFGL